jgi:hypothetical protein
MGARLYLGHAFLASFSMLSYEILLTRIFAVSQWNHLFFLVISIALFGLAASGTATAIWSASASGRRGIIDDRRWPSGLSGFQAVSIIGSYLGLNHLPLDYYRLAMEPVQLIYLLAAYLLLALPFFAAGLVISTAYAARPRSAGTIYFATMLGSAGGAAFPLALIPMLGEPLLVMITALLPLAVLPFCRQAPPGLPGAGAGSRPAVWPMGLPGILAAILILYLISPQGRHLIDIRSSEYKGLNQALRLPDTRVVASHRQLQGHIDRISGPYLRYAPGLSLHHAGRLPHQQVVFNDRDVPLTLYSPDSSDLAFSRATLSYAAYAWLGRIERVLAIPRNGGLSIACALSSGAGDLRVAIRHPDLAKIVRAHYGVPVTTDDPRAFLARDRTGYDIIHLENWGSTIPGADALTQDHSMTIGAFEAYLNALNPGGVLTLSRKLILPPSDSLRLWATAHEALTRAGIGDPGSQIVVLRNWDTYVLLVSRAPLKNRDRLFDFVTRHSFDVVFAAGMPPETANRFNVLPRPHYALALQRLAGAYAGAMTAPFFRAYPLDVAPQSDLRPFPGRMLKWTKLRILYQSIGRRLNSFFLSGEVIVGVTLLEALLVAGVMLVAPRRFIMDRRAAPRSGQGLYFFGVGCGFMLFEIYMIHFTGFVLGDPVLGFSAVITGLLAFSGLGGLLSRQWPLTSVRMILPVLIALFAVQLAWQAWHPDGLLKFAFPTRLLLALLIMLPAGLLIGAPFPVGMKHLAVGATGRTYAWSVNGCASVLSAILAAQLVISFGMAYLLIGAMIAYAISLTGVTLFFRSHPPVDNAPNHDNKICR